MTIEERADKLYDAGSGSIESIALNSLAKKDYIQGAKDQLTEDIETIPQLYIRWIMLEPMEGVEKPTWQEYINNIIDEKQ